MICPVCNTYSVNRYRPNATLCIHCEAEADGKLLRFLRSLEPAELEFIDYAVEGYSLVDIAKEKD